MDNVTHAIFLAFAMFALVIGLSFSVYLLNSMNSVATILIHSTDKTRNYQTVSYDSSNLLRKAKLTNVDKNTAFKTRIVSVDTVTSTLYRYYNDGLTIEIYDSDGVLNQVFDLDIEQAIGGSSPLNDDIINAYKDRYNKSNTQVYLYDAPWIGSPNLIKKRIDLYVSSKRGYIGTKLVDYESVVHTTSGTKSRGLKNLVSNGSKFIEEFVQYAYSGDTFSEINGDDIETITGNVKEQKKIIIKYIQMQE